MTYYVEWQNIPTFFFWPGDFFSFQEINKQKIWNYPKFWRWSGTPKCLLIWKSWNFMLINKPGSANLSHKVLPIRTLKNLYRNKMSKSNTDSKSSWRRAIVPGWSWKIYYWNFLRIHNWKQGVSHHSVVLFY